VLLRADGVSDAAVVPSATGNAVAYVTPATTEVFAVAQLLRRELPHHLVPDRIVAVDGALRRPDRSVDPAALARRGAAAAAQREGAPAGPRDHVERALLECFADGLGRSDLGVDDDFFASGGTSLSAARLVGALSDAVGAPVPLKMLFQHPSVGELSAALASEGVRAGQLTALEAATQDQSLPVDIVPSGRPRTGRASTVFLTGATGFVGSHLLAQLLAASMARVGCLVRGPDDASCARRLRDRVELYGLEVDWDRVDVVRGDLCDPLLGLERARFAEIADGADLIYHLGAHMNFLRPYRVLHGPNVHGTLEIVRLACTGRPSILHYVSTIDSQAGEHLQEHRVPVSAGRNDGYVLTKKTAEQLVLQAGARGLPIGIYRPWQITSHTRTGAVNPQDQLALCLTGILLTGVAPSDNPLPLRMLPVDVVTQVLIEMAERVDADAPVHHFYNPRVTPIEVVCDVVREAGYPVRLVPYQRWRLEVVRRTAGRVDGLAALLADDASQATLPRQVDTDNLVRHLGYAPRWPASDRDWVRRTIEFLVATGVAAPAHRTTGADPVRA
jgi:myxalamid-type nonribosomal peptide synthetase MxaA